MSFDLLNRRTTSFVLWVPDGSQQPSLVLGTLTPGTPATFSQRVNVAFNPATGSNRPSLWEVPCTSLGLPDGVYHYWFKVEDTSPNNYGSMLVTDPIAYTVDYRLVQQPGKQPASVIKLHGGQLKACDPAGDEPGPLPVPELSSLAPNNQLVIYELPVSWTRADLSGGDIGTFNDILALLQKDVRGTKFSNVAVVSQEAVLDDLGINALELLPLADSKDRDGWGYSPANYFAPDYYLGYPTMKASVELTNLIRRCHDMGIRFISDIVMAFGYDPYVNVDYSQFHLQPRSEPNNPDSYQSGQPGQFRDGYGGESWRYIRSTETYDPQTGGVSVVCPASVFHRAHLARWMSDFHLAGVRLDSLNNVANWDFIRQFRADALSHFADRYPSSDNDTQTRAARFLVVGEELSLPLDMIRTGCVDALWNEAFQSRLRAAIVGESAGGDDFEWTVRKMVDCRLLGFPDGAAAVNYITSHDTEGYRKERLYNFLDSMGVWEKEQRAKLAFACFLTAVGVPMIFSGEEFCDQEDEPAVFPYKEHDPVNWARKSEPWRSRVFDYVTRLVAFRKRSPALAVNDTSFIHADFTSGRNILAWVRGGDPRGLVVVVANFSPAWTPGPVYVVNNWPATPAGMQWREITQVRAVPPEWVGREPLFPWEAKVYELY